MGVQAPMSEPGEPGGTEADSAVEAGKNGRQPAPARGLAQPHTAGTGWDANQVRTYSSFQHPRAWVAPRPIRPFRAVLKITAALSAGWPSSARGSAGPESKGASGGGPAAHIRSGAHRGLEAEIMAGTHTGPIAGARTPARCSPGGNSTRCTSSSIQDIRPRRKPWPVKAVCRWILIITAYVMLI